MQGDDEGSARGERGARAWGRLLRRYGRARWIWLRCPESREADPPSRQERRLLPYHRPLDACGTPADRCLPALCDPCNKPRRLRCLVARDICI